MLAHLGGAPLVVGDLLGGRAEEGAVEGEADVGVSRAEVVQARRVDAAEDRRWPDDGAAVTEYARRCAELADEAGRLEEVDLALVLAQRDLAGDKDVEVARRLSLGEEERALVCADGLEELGQALDLFVAEATEEGDAAQFGWADSNPFGHGG